MKPAAFDPFAFFRLLWAIVRLQADGEPQRSGMIYGSCVVRVGDDGSVEHLDPLGFDSNWVEAFKRGRRAGKG